MGIHELYKFMKNQGIGVLITPLSSFSEYKVALDGNYMMYSYMAVAINDKLIEYYKTADRSVVIEKWLSMFEQKAKLFKKNKVDVVWVFDGGAPVDKNGTKEERKKVRINNKEKVLKDFRFKNVEIKKLQEYGQDIKFVEDDGYRVDLNDLKNNVSVEYGEDVILRDFLKKIGEEVVVKEGREAEEVCAEMCKTGEVAAVFSADSDLVAYRCPIIIKNIEGSNAHVISMELILKELQLTEEQLINFCIMLGTDYNERIPNYGMVKCYKIAKEHNDILKYFESIGVDTKCLRYNEVKKIFLKH